MIYEVVTQSVLNERHGGTKDELEFRAEVDGKFLGEYELE